MNESTASLLTSEERAQGREGGYILQVSAIGTRAVMQSTGLADAHAQ